MKLKWLLVLAVIVSVCAGAQEAAKPAQSTSAPPRCPGVAKFPQRLDWQVDCTGKYAAHGTRCLFFPDVVMHGTITNADGRVRAIVNDPRFPKGRTYFLGQYDELYNGRVLEITEKSLVLCEFVSDRQGNASIPHEVIFPIAGKPNPSSATNSASVQPQQAAISKKTRTTCTSGRFTGEKYNFHVQDVNILDFFWFIHEMTGLNVILDSGVEGAVTLDAAGMPWDQALAVAMKNNGLECELWGNVLHIARLETLKSQVDRLNGNQDAMPKTGCLPAEIHGAPLNLNLRELDLNDWFRLIHEVSQLNLAVEPDVKGTITINVTDLPWERALDFSARINGFRCEFEGNSLRILSAR